VPIQVYGDATSLPWAFPRTVNPPRPRFMYWVDPHAQGCPCVNLARRGPGGRRSPDLGHLAAGRRQGGPPRRI